MVLARPPSRDLTRHGCRVRAYTDVLAACPARVGGQGPCSHPADHPNNMHVHCLHHAHPPSRLVLARPPSRDLTRHGCRVRAYTDVLAACPARVGGQGPCSHPADHPNNMHVHCLHHAHPPSRLVLARPPSRDLTRHGCRVRAYTDVLAACPARVGGQGPCSHPADHPNNMHVHCLHHAHPPSRLVLARPPSRDLTRHGCRVRAYMDVLAACPARVGGQGPCSQPADHPNKMHRALLAPCTPTIPTGPCPSTVAGPYAT